MKGAVLSPNVMCSSDIELILAAALYTFSAMRGELSRPRYG
jgi:hypothetical protein